MDEISDGLWISNIEDVREESTAPFDRVITVCQESVEDNVGCAYHFFNMSDGDSGYGGRLDQEIFSNAVETVRDALEEGETVLVHCHRGRSRSVSVSIAALAAHNGWTYRQAQQRVASEREIWPDEALVEQARNYIEREA